MYVLFTDVHVQAHAYFAGRLTVVRTCICTRTEPLTGNLIGNPPFAQDSTMYIEPFSLLNRIETFYPVPNYYIQRKGSAEGRSDNIHYFPHFFL